MSVGVNIVMVIVIDVKGPLFSLVLKAPGWTTMTLTPQRESSCLIAPLNEISAALDAPYPANPGSGTSPEGNQWLISKLLVLIGILYSLMELGYILCKRLFRTWCLQNCMFTKTFTCHTWYIDESSFWLPYQRQKDLCNLHTTNKIHI